MAFRKFEVMISVRVIALSVVIALGAFTFFQTQWQVSSLILILLAALQVWELIRYVNKTNRDLSNFLDSIRFHDFTANFSSGGRGQSYDALKDSFNGIIHSFRTLEAEKESHYHYLQTVIEHIGVALICFDGDDQVVLMNNAAKELLSKPYIKRIGALEKVDEQLMSTIRSLHSGDKELVKLLIQGEIHQIALQATEFSLLGKAYKLLSFQDIRSELDMRELEAWQKLIRVLTHEIMNSITPVSTLSGVLAGMLKEAIQKQEENEPLEKETLEDISLGLSTIETRTQGLMRFVQAYRSILKIPKPDFKEVVVQEMLVRIKMLLKGELESRGIELKLEFSGIPVVIMADPNLVEQVLINLVKNAMEALEGRTNPVIQITILQPKETKTLIEVGDNGPGIDSEYIDHVFIPFFTTKKEGSGIGLSLSRQVMQLHKGSISFRTVPGEGTVFVLEF